MAGRSKPTANFQHRNGIIDMSENRYAALMDSVEKSVRELAEIHSRALLDKNKNIERLRNSLQGVYDDLIASRAELALLKAERPSATISAPPSHRKISIHEMHDAQISALHKAFREYLGPWDNGANCQRALDTLDAAFGAKPSDGH